MTKSQRQWLWFAGLWLAGLLVTAAVAEVLHLLMFGFKGR